MSETIRVATMAMYCEFAPLQEATDRLWASLRDRLRAYGVEGVPYGLESGARYDAAWLDPGLLLAQTCGYPYVRHLRGTVRLVATPEYGHPGCAGPMASSFIVVRKGTPVEAIDDLRGARAAINDPGSNSGMNLLRASVAPHARGGRFFSSVLQTGSHEASIAAVSQGYAAVAAIDCVTFGNILRFEPRQLEEIAILAETPSGPGLPLVTGRSTTDAELELLRKALFEAAGDPELQGVLDVLSLRGFHVLDDPDYDALLRLEQDAIEAGYPVVA